MSQDPPRESPKTLRPCLERVREIIVNYLEREDLEGISRGVRHQLASGGKRLRPSWSLWMADALGSPRTAAESFALGLELLHNVLLIHDDIEDGDRFRRGIPTLWVEYGVPEALNVADYLLAESYRLVGEAAQATPAIGPELLGEFTAVFRTTAIGQALDLSRRAAPGFTLEAYEEIVRQKTGRYLSLAWTGAAILSGADPAVVRTLRAVGEDIGPAFQIRDDLLDLTLGKGRGGEIGCDIREGKPSLPYAFALERGNLDPADRDRLVAIQATERESTTDADVDWTIELYRRCGALEFGENEARRRIEAGIRGFESLSSLPKAVVAEFRSIAEYVVERRV